MAKVTAKATLRFDMTLDVEEREGYLAGTFTALGITVYADDEDALIKRIEQAMEFLFNSHGKSRGETIISYLNKHGVKHSVEHVRPLRRTVNREIKVPVAA